jgi:hypothetical protein
VTGYSLLDLVVVNDVLVPVELGGYRVNGGRSYETGRSEARCETRGALLGLVLVTGWADTPRTHRGELLKDESGETRGRLGVTCHPKKFLGTVDHILLGTEQNEQLLKPRKGSLLLLGEQES